MKLTLRWIQWVNDWLFSLIDVLEPVGAIPISLYDKFGAKDKWRMLPEIPAPYLLPARRLIGSNKSHVYK